MTDSRPSSVLKRRARKLAHRTLLNLADASHKDVLLRAAIRAIARRVLRGRPKPGQCCEWESRSMEGGCLNCDDPCL